MTGPAAGRVPPPQPPPLPPAVAACLADLAAGLEAQLRLARGLMALGQGAGAGGGPQAPAAAIAALAGALDELRACLPPGARGRAARPPPPRAAPPLAPCAAGIEQAEVPAAAVPASRRSEAGLAEGSPALAGEDPAETSFTPATQEGLALTPWESPRLCGVWAAGGRHCNSKAYEDDFHTAPSQEALGAISDLQTERVGEVRDAEIGTWSRWLVMAPNSWKVLIWDILSVVVLSWDFLTVPMMAFEHLLADQRFDYAHLAVLVFWTADVPVSFFTGYLDNGRLELNLPTIVRRRMKVTLLHLLITGTDWCLFLLQHSGFVALLRLGKLLRLMRLLRWVQLARLKTLTYLFEDATEVVLSETLFACLNIVKLLLCVMVFCHYGACFWYALGSLQGSGGAISGWVSNLEEMGPLHVYLVSFHWIFAQFTPAAPPSQASPTTFVEELGIVCLLVVGWVLFMFLMGSVNASLQVAKADASKRIQGHELFRQYAAQHRLPLVIYNRVLNFARSRHLVRTTVVEGDMPFLSELPESLRRDLRFAIFSQVLGQHPLLHELFSVRCSFMMDLCNRAVHSRPLGKGDELFANRTTATKMFFIRRLSEDEYGRQPQNALEFLATVSDGADSRHHIKEGQWFCEVTLWFSRDVDEGSELPLQHTGLATALHVCDVAEMEAPRFRDIAKNYPRVLEPLSNYAALFHEAILENHSSAPELWGTDRHQCLSAVREVFPRAKHRNRFRRSGA